MDFFSYILCTDFHVLIFNGAEGVSVERVWLGKVNEKLFPLTQPIKQLPLSKALKPHLLQWSCTGCRSLWWHFEVWLPECEAANYS